MSGWTRETSLVAGLLNGELSWGVLTLLDDLEMVFGVLGPKVGVGEDGAVGGDVGAELGGVPRSLFLTGEPSP